MMFEEITASSLVKIDLDARKVQGSPYPINPAGFTIHAAGEDARCVLHAHSLNGVAVSAQRHGVLPISQQSTLVLASLAYHDYEGIALRDEERLRLVRDLGDKSFLMLRNHGLLTAAPTIPDAFLLMYIQAGGGELIHVDPKIIEGATDVGHWSRIPGGISCGRKRGNGLSPSSSPPPPRPARPEPDPGEVAPAAAIVRQSDTTPCK